MRYFRFLRSAQYQTKHGCCCEDQGACESQCQNGSESESQCECECESESESESESATRFERVRVMVRVGGESERGAWEVRGERET